MGVNRIFNRKDVKKTRKQKFNYARSIGSSRKESKEYAKEK